MERRSFILAGASAVLAGCSNRWNVGYENGIDGEVSKNWHIHAVQVIIPSALTVSNANNFAPNADIVWHGDTDATSRRQQVASILREGISQGGTGLQGPRSVNLRAELEKFHAVTPASVARAPGAVHNIAFVMQIFDDATGRPLSSAERIQADLEAYVGAAAVTAAVQGQTQRVRVVEHIAQVTRGWLGDGPDQRRRFAAIGR